MTVAEAPAVPRHPAKWLPRALEAAGVAVAELCQPPFPGRRGPLILDPFAGTGAIHRLRDTVPGAVTVGLELEPEWAAAHPGTIPGDVLAMPPEWSGQFDAVVSSCCYGNRMSDHHDARDDSRRNTYKHALGRDLSPGSAAEMQWGSEYRRFHRKAMIAIMGVLGDRGVICWNVKNHYRDGAEQLVAEWHLRTWLELGARLVSVATLPATGNRQGANGTLRTEAEFLFVLRVPVGAPRLL